MACAGLEGVTRGIGGYILLPADTEDLWKTSQERTGLEWSSLVVLRADPCVDNAWLGIALFATTSSPCFQACLTYGECCI